MCKFVCILVSWVETLFCVRLKKKNVQTVISLAQTSTTSRQHFSAATLLVTGLVC